MNGEFHSIFHYQIGGSLPADAPTYIARKADRDLFDALLAGEYCYILNARQMGKSSLRVQTMSKLQELRIACTEIELSGIGSQQIISQQWYGGIVQEIIDGFELQIDRRRWWRSRDDLSPVKRLGEFIETILLKQIQQNIVIFIDEIDSILSLEFPTDDFFTLIHNFYDKRATKPEYRRLTFALMGVATPAELIQDERSTPFNIGRSIELKGFQLSESIPLAKGFSNKVSDPKAILAQVLSWTGGQPFLTQKLCWLIEQNSANIDERGIAELVKTHILEDWESQDNPEHLRTIRDRLCRYHNHDLDRGRISSSRDLLKIYRRILQRGKITWKNCLQHLELQLTGLVCQDRGNLVVKNRIYKEVFDLNWVERRLQELDKQKPNPLSISKAVLISLAVAGSIIGIRSLGWLETWELKSFDALMRLRPAEKMDKRLLIISITEEDVQAQPAHERGAASLSDRSLAQLLEKLERSSARAVGLDIYREVPLAQRYQNQIAEVLQSDRFVAICKYGNRGVPHSPKVISQDGFNNLSLDRDRVIRRHILAVDSPSPCQSYYSFNWQLATLYLRTRGIETEVDDYLQLGNTVFKPLTATVGGYHNLDNQGNQILLNCRNTSQIAPTVTLQEFLSDRFNLDLLEDRIVLIGTTATSFNDYRWRTSCCEEETGVEIQAQMTSQILSSVLDGRPLIWSLSTTGELIAILSCSLVGGAIVYYQGFKIEAIWYISLGVILIFGGSELLIITVGGWFPTLPSTLVLVITSGILSAYQYYCSSKE